MLKLSKAEREERLQKFREEAKKRLQIDQSRFYLAMWIIQTMKNWDGKVMNRGFTTMLQKEAAKADPQSTIYAINPNFSYDCDYSSSTYIKGWSMRRDYEAPLPAEFINYGDQVMVRAGQKGVRLDYAEFSYKETESWKSVDDQNSVQQKLLYSKDPKWRNQLSFMFNAYWDAKENLEAVDNWFGEMGWYKGVEGRW